MGKVRFPKSTSSAKRNRHRKAPVAGSDVRSKLVVAPGGGRVDYFGKAYERIVRLASVVSVRKATS